MKNLHTFALLFTFASTTTFLIAQTELMDDVDAVKENANEDLYAPDDEETSAASSAANPTQAATPSTQGAQEISPDIDPLDTLPVVGGTKPESALTGSDGTSAELSAIRIYPLPDRTRFEIQTSKIVDYLPERSTRTKQFTLNLANTNLGPLVSKGPINAKEFGGPVNAVQAYESRSLTGTNARVVMNMVTLAEPSIRREGNRLIVDFLNSGSTPETAKAQSNELPSDFETLISLNGKQNFTGTKVNFRAKDASVPDVMQFISQVSGKNFVLVGEMDKRITMNVKNIPWDQMLAIVLLNAELGYQKQGNTYRVMPVSKIRQEIADSIKAQEDEDKLAPKATQLFPLSYAKTSEVIPQITKYLKTDFSENVVSDERTNSIVVTALPKNIQRIRRYIEAIDKQTPVVQIEARIVQASKGYERQLGIDWRAVGAFKLANGLVVPSAVVGGTGFGANGAPDPQMNFGVNGGIGGSYANSSATLRQLDAVLKLNESKSVIRELSRPSLTVLNNKKASIIDGTQTTLILRAGAGDDTGTTKTVEGNLSLTVTPQVTNDNNIMLNIVLTRNSLGEVNPETNSVDLSRREINTETLIESGATVVIGGVYIKEDTNADGGWPFLRKLPILGRLFTSNDFKKETERELLMFISPRILNKERASVMQQTLEEAR